MKNVKDNKNTIKFDFRNNLSKSDNTSSQSGISHKRHRKGVVDVQFNWIFVLIAGFVIFLFIISIAFSQKRSAENQAGIDVMNQITTLLKGKQQTSNMYSEITFSRSNVEFICDPEFNQFSFKIGDSKPTTLPVEIIFAPRQMDTNKFMVWSQPFNLGFSVGVFTYITSPNSIILIVNDSDVTSYDKQLFEDLDSVSNITHKYISNGNEYSDFARRTIVCFSNDANPPISSCPTDAQKFDYIKIIPATTDIFDYGTVTFHKKGYDDAKDNKYTYPYLTKAGLYGAIFSDSADLYKCQMSRALTQFEIKRLLIQTNLVLIQNALAPEGECRAAINVTLDTEIASMGKPLLTTSNITNLYIQSKNLDTRNTYLNVYSCPTIY